MSANLLEVRHGTVTVLTMNRPAKRNALTLELVTGLRSRIQAALADETVGGIVLTGAPPAFCAGMDLNVVVADAGEPGHASANANANAIVTELCELYCEIHSAPKPVVAAVNGAAVAGGAGLVTVCDIAVAAESAVIGYPEIKRGVVAAVVMTYLIRCVGERRAKYLLLTGDLISAPQALAAGLVSECVADEACLPRAIELTGRLAGYPAGAYAKTKQVLNEVQQLDPRAGLEKAREMHNRLSMDPQSVEAIERFLKKP